MALTWLDLLATVLLGCVPMAIHGDARPSRRHEVLLGRCLAACAHPLLAWRSGLRSFRVLLLACCFTAGYLTVLLTMVLLS